MTLKAIEEVLASPQETAKVFRDIKNDGVFDTASKVIGNTQPIDCLDKIFLYAKAAEQLDDAIERAEQLTAVRLAVAIASIIDDSSLSSIEKWCQDSKWERRYVEKYHSDFNEY